MKEVLGIDQYWMTSPPIALEPGPTESKGFPHGALRKGNP
jgi:hypothetical protein